MTWIPAFAGMTTCSRGVRPLRRTVFHAPGVAAGGNHHALHTRVVCAHCGAQFFIPAPEYTAAGHNQLSMNCQQLSVTNACADLLFCLHDE